MKRLLETIGNTPLVPVRKLSENSEAAIAVKLEKYNPGGSVKDRIALSMVRKAEDEGRLEPGGTIVEPTSGNTGIGLAIIATTLGYKLKAVMPESVSLERQQILVSYSAEMILTPVSAGIFGAIEKAKEIVKNAENTFMPMQFENSANPEAHRKTTGPEIWEDTGGKVDGIICGIGTGGTITGVGEFLKSRKSSIEVYAVEPNNSAVLSGGSAGPHTIEGIGTGFIPKILNREIIDEVIPVAADDARNCSRLLAAREGIFAGISSGAALYAALKIAKRPWNRDKLYVVILPDGGEKYLSTGLWDSQPGL